MPIRRAPLYILSGAALLLLSLSAFFVTVASAGHAKQEQPTATPQPDASATQTTPSVKSAEQNLSIANEVCLACHGVPGETVTLPSGEVWDLYVTPEMYQDSVHGQLGYACVQCHTDVGEYPHPPFQAKDLRDVTLKMKEVCARCHTRESELELDSVHTAARADGVREAAVCSDCHTAHEVRRLTDPNTRELLPDVRQWIPERCGLCHSKIYQEYAASVHGSALSEGNPDVPTCVDCHGVHNIEDPRTAYFRLRSPHICAKCHTDPALMSKYGLTTDVLNTYVDDFHGTTAVLFEKLSPDAQVNTPVCYDCHGVHDISSTNDPATGLQIKANLLARCQICHPDATTNFPTAWMSHYVPSPQVYPLVYYVNLFYKFFIPITLGGMALLVVLDVSRGLINRRGKDLTQRAEEHGETGQATVETDASSETNHVREGSDLGEDQDANTASDEVEEKNG